MKTTKTIAIVGATGNMGSAIARALATAGGYRLLLMSGNPDKLSSLKSDLEQSTNATQVIGISCAKEASWEADIIIVATPYEAEREVAEKIREVATGKVVVSISNPLNANFNDTTTSPNFSAAEELQRLLPHSKVVKAFNTAVAGNFRGKTIDGKMVDAFVAGNNGDAVEMVSEIIKSAGLNPIIAGDLSVSRTLERMQLLLIRLGTKHNYN